MFSLSPNIFSPYCGPTFCGDRIPFNLITDWSFEGAFLSFWPNVKSTNELTWMETPAYVESPIKRSPIVVFDYPSPIDESISPDGCCSPDAIPLKRFGGALPIERINTNKWCFPPCEPPPLPLPGWMKLPYPFFVADGITRAQLYPNAEILRMNQVVFIQWSMCPVYSVSVPSLPCPSVSFSSEYKNNQISPLPTNRHLIKSTPLFNNSQEFVKSLILKLETEHGVYFTPPYTYSGDLYGGLERFWMNAFMWLFLEFYEMNHLWTLKPVEKPPKDDDKGYPWECIIHTAKVRFNCEANHGWTSMQGRVVFWFRILHGIDNGYLKGEVVFKLYGQKCDRCTKNSFETALWYPEEIAYALWNLYCKIAERCYGRPAANIPRGLRGGKPLRPHQQSLCQACSDGICRVGKGSKSVR